ncbi:MAG: ribosome rescue protein RqcH [Saccharolobus sp.]|uniref:ribosome rescue protein RqcH n=1 Tax=Saccharolobus sp. TaxID=2100761 RepID=UPI0028CE5E17|nr:ribosome rescue protein RqcH [Saccharolobus sp.]MDT7861453.1 ribosome rescue protein RqcH [Saccharolobus sp.]
MTTTNIKLHRKSSMSYFDLLAWVTENKETLLYCIIDNIFSIENIENAFIFKLHCQGKDQELIIEPSKRINFTKYNYPKSSSGKVTLLRELLRGDIITDISILGRERILLLTLKKGKKIIVELLPRGLLVVTDNEDKILFSTEYKEFRDRKIKIGEKYIKPPSIEISNDEIEKLIKKGNLARALGVPQEVVIYLNLTNFNDLEIIKKKISELENLISNGNIKPCIIENLTVLPFPINDCKEYQKFNDAIDDYFYTITQEELTKETSKKIEEEKEKIINTIIQLENSIKEYEQKGKIYQQIGNIILTKTSEIQQILSNLNKKERKVKINLEGFEIELDTSISIPKNASKFFEEAKEYKRKLSRALESLNELKKKLEKLEKEKIEKQQEIKITLRKKEWYEKYRWSISRNGFLILAGKDSSQNESLVRKFLEDNDIFLHADIQGAPATIIKTQNKIPSEEDIMDAAIIAACYSKAWKLGFASVDVFWTFGNQVSKSPPSGEYLAKGSFMIYGKKNFIKNVKLELAMGFIINNDTIKVLVGSEDSVKNKTNYYVILRPGDDEKEKVADKIIKIMNRILQNVKGLNSLKNEIIDKIPAKSKIIKTSITYNS